MLVFVGVKISTFWVLVIYVFLLPLDFGCLLVICVTVVSCGLFTVLYYKFCF